MSNFIAMSPSGTDIPPDTTPQTRINWVAIQGWFAVEHYSLSAGASAGGHKRGINGVVYFGTSSQISSLTSAGSGALAWSTDEGFLMISDPASGWNRITWNEFSRVRSVLSDVTAIVTTTWTRLPLDLSDPYAYDGLGEFSSYRITFNANGYYLISAKCIWDDTSNEQFLKELAIYKNGSPVAYDRIYGSEGISNLVEDVQYCAASDYIEIYVYHNRGSDLNLTSALHMSRLS